MKYLRSVLTKVAFAALAIGMFFGTKSAICAQAKSYGLWVGKYQITDANKDSIPGIQGGSAKFDPETNTLTFIGNVTGIEKGDKLGAVFTELDEVTVKGNVSVKDYMGGFVFFNRKGKINFQGEFDLSSFYGCIYANQVYISGKMSASAVSSNAIRGDNIITIDGKVSAYSKDDIAISSMQVKFLSGSIDAEGKIEAFGGITPRGMSFADGSEITLPEGGKLNSSGTNIVDKDGKIAKHVKIEKIDVNNSEYDLGTLTFDLRSGSTNIVFKDEKEGVAYAASGLCFSAGFATEAGKQIRGGSQKGYCKLDSGDSDDILMEDKGEEVYVSKLSTCSCRGTTEFNLNDEGKKRCISNGYYFYSTFRFIFEDLDKGAYSVDLTSGHAEITSMDVATAVFNTAWYIKEEKVIREDESKPVNPYAGVSFDLNDDKTADVKAILKVNESSYTLILDVLDTNTMTENYVITKDMIKVSIIEAKNNPYYSTLTFVFKKAETAAPTVAEGGSHKQGDEVVDGGVKYVITSVEEGKQAVTYSKPESAKATSASIPATITIDDKEYKVTEIAANAFANNKKLKKITIGANIEKIGKKAFYKCKNLKSVTIKSTLLTKKTVGSAAFKGIHPNAKVKVPKKMLKNYQKFLKGKGINGANQKIK